MKSVARLDLLLLASYLFALESIHRRASLRSSPYCDIVAIMEVEFLARGVVVRYCNSQELVTGIGMEKKPVALPLHGAVTETKQKILSIKS